ncbi:C-C motif chemokine 20-like [Hyperolius riggenbachi]|uniref:C-C motif chemokine 20-like n=1 Tax=Hyperolius riggenbachi TaxID=752182 RepID=UPI0035A28439
MLPPSHLSSVLLLVVTYLCSGILCSEKTLIDYRRPIRVQVTCCTAVSRAQLKGHSITDFKIQSPLNQCVYAVIFHTKKSESFCVDPRAKWAQKKVKVLSNGTFQLPRSGKGKKGGKGEKRGKGGKKQNKKKNNMPLPVTSTWFPSTTATTAQIMP